MSAAPTTPEQYVMDLGEIDATQIAVVGGKGAQLGELTRIDGVRVPPGFCVTTAAFRRIVADAPAFHDRLDRLSRLGPDDREQIRTLSGEIREIVDGVVLPDDVSAAIKRALASLGGDVPCAVRSSATAEDLPTASFAGQQDSYLNVVGAVAVLRHVSRCWASLFTERAVTYRQRNGIDHRAVRMAVVVQHMVDARAAGVLFTADPVTSNRKVASVEAVFGLGDALVSGLVNPDVSTVHDDVVARDPERRAQPVLTDAQAVRLVQLGRRIEAHFGRPQDIEWCLADDGFHVVQSRPITTLFPIPDVGDDEQHVYLSVGHAQMMTDPMKPLGISMWQLTAGRPMHEAGGRLFVDVTRELASSATRAGLMAMVGRSDPLTGDALQTLLDRGDIVPSSPDGEPAAPPAGAAAVPVETDPALVTELIRRSQESIATSRRDIRSKSGPALFDFILADIHEMRRPLFDPHSHQVLMAGFEAAWWLNDQLHGWLGETNAADVLMQSVPHDVTAEMGLALLDVADAIRPHPDVVAFLEDVDGSSFLAALDQLAGGLAARAAIEAWLERYGMRCVGEIDITRPRWSERPDTLVPVILANVKHFEPGERMRRFERGQQEASTREHELLTRLRALPDGEQRAAETKGMIDRLRAFIWYREYPKYSMISRYLIYKHALLAEAERLVQGGALEERDDCFYLTFQELHGAVRTGHVDDELIRRRKDAFRSYQALTPPRVLTSDGEAVAGTYRRDDVPAGALIGLAVSAGTVEGRARVVLDMAQADLEPGDILVTPHTDPSWTPLFVSVAGLVTEVGGSMTHGAVVAREYGLPAVVGVDDATGLIADGQRIRVHGTAGYVEILERR